MIYGKLLEFDSDLSKVFEIRTKVFVEELGISKDEEFDTIDKEAVHVLVYEESFKNNKVVSENDNNAIATGRIYLSGDQCILGHIAVLKDYRNKKYGDFTVKMLINRAFTAGIKEVILTSKEDTLDFFKKVGFQIYNENNKDDGILYRMKISQENIIRACNNMKK